MPRNLSQPGEEASELNAQAIKEQLADIRDKVEQQKIPLSKEVEAYTRQNLRKVAGKLQAGEPVYPSDMEFIGKVKMWMEMPAEWRDAHDSIAKMEGSEEMGEAGKRSITPKQWLTLIQMGPRAFGRDRAKEWIDRMFEFPGNKIIKVMRDFKASRLSGLKSLPDNLVVEGDLYLTGLTELINLPDNLVVRGCLYLEGCTGLDSLPVNLKVGTLRLSANLNEKVKRDAERLKREGKIKGNIELVWKNVS